MRPNWRKITDPTDPKYDGANPVYEATWYGGTETLTEIPPSGHNDTAGWTIALDESAPTAVHRSGKRWTAQRSAPPRPDAPELDATPLT